MARQPWKPSIYFCGGTIPRALKNVEPGTRTTLVVTGRVAQRTEAARPNEESLAITIDRIRTPKAGPKKRGRR